MKMSLILTPLMTLALCTSIAAGERNASSPVKSGDDPTGFYLKAQYLYQNTDYALSSLDLELNPRGVPPQLLAIVGALGKDAVEAIEDSSHTTSAFLEWRPVGWLGLNARLGRIEGESEITLAAPFQDTTLNYSGTTYGFGPTLLTPLPGSVGRFEPFAMVAAEWARVEFDDDGGHSEIWPVRPRIGLKGERLAFWVGASWLNASQSRHGELNIAPLGETGFRSESENIYQWNYTAGVSYEMTNALRLSVESGFGDRQHVGVVLSYHF